MALKTTTRRRFCVIVYTHTRRQWSGVASGIDLVLARDQGVTPIRSGCGDASSRVSRLAKPRVRGQSDAEAG
jgi:hypothetical protein